MIKGRLDEVRDAPWHMIDVCAETRRKRKPPTPCAGLSALSSLAARHPQVTDLNTDSSARKESNESITSHTRVRGIVKYPLYFSPAHRVIFGNYILDYA